MKNKLEQIKAEAQNKICQAQSTTDLENIKNEYLSRKGELTSIKRILKICLMMTKEL